MMRIRLRHPGRAWALAGLFTILSACLYAACGRNASSASLPTDSTIGDAAPRVRLVRVLIAGGAASVRVRSDALIRAGQGERMVELPALSNIEWLLIDADPSGQVRIDGQSTDVSTLRLDAVDAAPLWVVVSSAEGDSPALAYGGSLQVHAKPSGRIDVINEVDVETYVSCVVPNEVWPTFDREAFRAQAIIARTYVLYLMGRRQRAAFDLSATEGSQVYRGLRHDDSGARGRGAAADTRGVVCVSLESGSEKLFPTYYSAACGGLTQSAAVFDGDEVAAPLRGGVACDYCKIAVGGAYRWGPVRMAAAQVLARVASRHNGAAALDGLRAIDVLDRTSTGRPTRLRLVGRNGATHELGAESFRLAVGSNEVRSTDCTVRVQGEEVIWENGRGFGHGLGLCQWGMEGQAKLGKLAAEILRYYYPGCGLSRAY